MKAKHIFLSLSFLFLALTASTAQEVFTVYTAKIDSLKQIIDARAVEDEEKVRLLNEYARLCFYNQEFQKGFIATRDARELSTKLNFEGGKIMYYLTLSAFQGEGQMHEYYRKQAQWLSMNADKQLGKYYEDLDIPNYEFGNDHKGNIDKFTIILRNFEKLGDKEIQANILTSLSYFNYLLGNIEESTNVQDRITNLYSDLGQVYPVFLSSSFKMGNLTALGRVNEAKKIELELIELMTRSENENALGLITSTMATGYSNSGRNGLAIEYHLKSIEAFKNIGDMEMLAETYRLMGIDYENMEMNSKALESYTNFLSVIETLKDSSKLYMAYNYLVSPLIALKKYDEAKKYATLALHDTISENKIYLIARYNDAIGQILRDQEKYAEAIPYFKKAFEGFKQHYNVRWSSPFMPLYLSNCYLKTGDRKKALEYALLCLDMENALNSNRTVIKSRVSLLLSEIYDQIGEQQQAYKFLKMYQMIRAESDKLDETNRIADAEIRSIINKSEKEITQLEKEKIQKVQESRNQRLWIFSISGALLSALILSLVLYKNNQNKQKANARLNQQKEEIQDTLEKLKSTQSQLIQSEKMASLGELTAGIAHEIQNPLNFVNNFSEVNSELIDELDEEAIKGNLEEVRAIAKDIRENEQKINHHGKRADAIVKGMLQHSRTSTGVREPTDINALSDEYLRLAYHGLRAKDKSFNADFKTEFDPNLPKINVIPQDIGRVLLNLINNAFYAVDKRVKDLTPQPPEGGVKNTQIEYRPTVTISTTSSKSPSADGDLGVKISVKDNGPGIPANIIDKIFQPFFTTKPTGQGTGLGLSLSYDIVKAHGGELKVETKEGVGSEFIIQIPISQ